MTLPTEPCKIESIHAIGMVISHGRAGLGPLVAAPGHLISTLYLGFLGLFRVFSTLSRNAGPPEVFGR